MTDTKISELSDGAQIQATDHIPVVRGGSNYRVNLSVTLPASGTLLTNNFSNIGQVASNVLFANDNTNTIGASGANRPANIYTVILTASTVNALGNASVGGALTIAGALTSSNTIFAGANNSFSWTGRSRLMSPSNGHIQALNNGSTAISTLAIGRQIQAKTANYSLAFTDSNSVISNTGASGTVNVTLPAATGSGVTATFYVDAAQTLQITAPASNTIRSGANVTAVAGNITANTEGNTITLVDVGTNKWVAIAAPIGTWTFS